MGPSMVTLSGSVISSPFTEVVAVGEVLVDCVLVGRLAESVISLRSIAVGLSAEINGTMNANSKKRYDSDGIVKYWLRRPFLTFGGMV